MFGMSMTELMLILVIGLIVLGPDRLPGLARGLGKATREFRKATREIRTTLEVEEIRRTVNRIPTRNDIESRVRNVVNQAAFGDDSDGKKTKETETETKTDTEAKPDSEAEAATETKSRRAKQATTLESEGTGGVNDA